MAAAGAPGSWRCERRAGDVLEAAQAPELELELETEAVGRDRRRAGFGA